MSLISKGETRPAPAAIVAAYGDDTRILRRLILRSGVAGGTRVVIAMATIMILGLVAYDVASDQAIYRFTSNGVSHVLWVAGNGIILACLVAGILYALVGTGVRNMAGALERLRVIFENSADGIFVCDVESGTFIDVNAAGCAMFGYAREDLVGQRMDAFASGDPSYPQSGVAAQLAELQSTGSQLFQLCCTTRDGRNIWVEVSARLASLGGRKVSLGILRDITARKLAENESAEKGHLLHALFDEADSAIFDADFRRLLIAVRELQSQGITDIDQVEPTTLQRLRAAIGFNSMNSAAYRLMEYERDWAQPQRPAIEVDGVSADIHMIGAMVRGEPRFRHEGVLKTRCGTQIPILISMPLPATEQEARRVPAVLVDLREVKMAEVARQANVAKSTFLARMSHELRTPLNGVVSNIDLLLDTTLSNDQRSLVQSARLSGETLLHIIGDILDFSKIESGKIELEKTTFRLPQILFDLDAMFRARAMSQGVSFVWRLDGAAPEVVEGDPLRLKQVLINLVANALRYTKQGGVLVRIKSTPTAVDHALLHVDVIDSGAGLDAATASRLFDPFVQADASTSRTHGGTGLGLAICRSLVELWEGDIGVDGTVGLGAHFWFTMPTKVVEAAPVHNVAEMVGSSANAHSRSRSFVLTSPDRTDRVLLDHLDREKLEYTLISDPEELVRACETYLKSEGRPPIAFIEESLKGPPMGLAAELAVRKAGANFHLLHDTVEGYQRALRAGFAAILPPHIDAATELRSVMLMLERTRTAGGSLRNYGVSGVAEAREQLLQMKNPPRLLILEDQPMNQLVIERQMSRLGLRFDVAENGIVGLERMKDGHYDLILCDCSMPQMDGFEFTRNVRAQEKASGRPPIPIIALTANVFTEDVDRCLKAGMNDFLAKPVKLEDLATKLLEWSRPAGGAPTSAVAPPSAPATAENAVDLTVLAEALGTDDPASLAGAYELYISEIDKNVERMKGYLRDRNATDLSRAAHGSKGDSRNAGAKKLGDLLQDLEKAASAGDWAVAEAALEKVIAERVHVIDFIRRHLLSRTERVA